MAMRQLLKRPKKIAETISFDAKLVRTDEHNSDLAKNLVLHEKGQITGSKFGWGDRAGQLTIQHPRANWDLYSDVYERVPTVRNAIDNTADFAVQCGYELEGDAGDKVKDWIEENNFDFTMLTILKQMQIYGNAYLEINGLKLLPPKQMFVVAAKGGDNDGEVIGYKQKVKYSESIEFKPDEIVHFKWDCATNPFYGISAMKPALSTITRLLNFQEDIGEVIHRYAQPILHHRMGTDDSPATATQISAYKSLLDDRGAGEDIITSTGVEINTIATDLRQFQPDGIIKHLENQVIAALRVPEIFVRGGQTSNKATADIEMLAFDRKVKAIRRILGELVSDKIFTTIVPHKVVIEWNEVSIEAEAAKAESMANLAGFKGAGLPKEVALKIVGWKKYIDDLKQYEKEHPSQFGQPGEQPFGKPKMPFGKPKPPLGKQEPEEEEELFEFKPPEAGKAPQEVKDVLKKVYDKCRSDWVSKHPSDKENAENKRRCSAIAWAAAKKATGYNPKEEDFEAQADYIEALTTKE